MTFTKFNVNVIFNAQIQSNRARVRLYIVDGVIVESLFGFNVYAVDHVEILKEANIYGAQGGNGAIVVYTKRGGNKY